MMTAWKKGPPEDGLSDVLVEHSVHGVMIARWNDKRTPPQYDAVGFRQGDHEGVAHPLVLLNLYTADVDRIKRHAVI